LLKFEYNPALHIIPKNKKIRKLPPSQRSYGGHGKFVLLRIPRQEKSPCSSLEYRLQPESYPLLKKMRKTNTQTKVCTPTNATVKKISSLEYKSRHPPRPGSSTLAWFYPLPRKDEKRKYSHISRWTSLLKNPPNGFFLVKTPLLMYTYCNEWFNLCC